MKAFIVGFYFDQVQSRIMCFTLKDRSLYSLLLCLKIAHLEVGRRSLKMTEVNINALTFINQNLNVFAQYEKRTGIYLCDISAGTCSSQNNEKYLFQDYTFI